MRIKIFNQTNKDVKPYEKLLKQLFRSIKEKGNLSIIFVEINGIQDLNRTYRQIDQPTDVLSFTNDDPKDKTLGDVFICLDKAIEQAISYGHRLEREIGFLAVHGYLHLKGYDHQTPLEEKEMIERQEIILQHAKLER